MANANSTEVPPIRTCALCGQRARSFIAFPLLTASCGDIGIELQAKDSPLFHPRCARLAYAEVMAFNINSPRRVS